VVLEVAPLNTNLCYGLMGVQLGLGYHFIVPPVEMAADVNLIVAILHAKIKELRHQ
jgi:hypothetical protein